MKEKIDITLSRLIPVYRTSRIAKGLKRTGDCRLTLLASSWDQEIIAPHFDSFIPFGVSKGLSSNKGVLDVVENNFLSRKMYTGMELFKEKMLPLYEKNLKKALKKVPENGVIHYTAPPVSLGKTIVENAPCAVAYDQYDLVLQSYDRNTLSDRIVADERYCLENASGIVHKGPDEELDFYREKNYNISEKYITYPDYCDPDHFKRTDCEKLEDGMHIVYLGGLNGPGKPYFILPEIKALTKKGFHVHVYPRMTSVVLEDISIYYEEEKKNERLHMHNPVPYPALLDEIKKYHFGLYFFNYDKEKFPQKTKKAKTEAGNKIPAYYEAGLPVIISKEMDYSAGFVSDYSAGITVNSDDLHNFDKKLEQYDLTKMRKGVEKAREDLSIDKHAPRLVEFYRSLL